MQPTFKKRQVVRGGKTEEGKEFHRLIAYGKKQELYRWMGEWPTSTQNSCEEAMSLVSCPQFLGPGPQ